MNQNRARIASLTVLALLTIACSASAAPTIKTRIEPVDHVPTSRTTVIDSQVTWGPGLQLVDEDVTIVDGGYLQILPGTQVVMTASVQFRIEAGGWLISFGNATSPVEFFGYNDTSWDGIRLIGDASWPSDTKLYLHYTSFEDANTAAAWGINAHVTIDDCSFEDGGVQLQNCHGYADNCTANNVLDFGAYVVGIYFYFTDCSVTNSTLGIGVSTVGSGSGIITGCTSSGGEFGSQIGDNVEVENCTFSGNEYGVVCTASSADSEISDCVITGNSVAGVFGLASGGAAIFSDCDISGNGSNIVIDSGSDASTIVLGNDATGQGGGNRIVNPTNYHVDNQASGTLKAELCYWGFGLGQLPDLEISGRVDYSPMIYTDPFAKTGDAGASSAFKCAVFPNPCNPAATIRYAVPAGGADVDLSVYDVRGRLVTTVVDARADAGTHDAVWRGVDSRGAAQASGVYIYKLTFDGHLRSTGRIVLAR